MHNRKVDTDTPPSGAAAIRRLEALGAARLRTLAREMGIGNGGTRKSMARRIYGELVNRRPVEPGPLKVRTSMKAPGVVGPPYIVGFTPPSAPVIIEPAPGQREQAPASAEPPADAPRVVVMAVDPHRVYVYWDASDLNRRRAAIRVIDLEAPGAPITEFSLPRPRGGTFVQVRPGRRYEAQIVLEGRMGVKRAARSEHAETPPGPSMPADEEAAPVWIGLLKGPGSASSR